MSVSPFPLCPQGGEIVDYAIGLCSCGTCPTPAPHFTPRQKRTCNRHADCDKADAESEAKRGRRAEHCHDDCCEDCFGQ